MLLNINRTVLVREQPRGVVAFNEHYRANGVDPEMYRTMYRQPDGRLKMPLWEVAYVYGSEMYMGPEPPIETTIEVLGV